MSFFQVIKINMSIHRTAPWRAWIALVLFGISFGFVEASVVVYLRDIYEPLVTELDASRQPGDLFPLITLEQLESADATYLSRLKTELLREGATLLMLAAAGLAISWNFNTFFSGFLIAFGVWDIFYYVFLKVLIDWPSSLLEWDLLFLIPAPWASPVLAPVLVATSMIGSGTYVLWREAAGRSVRIGWRNWCLIVLGGIVIVVSFCWDSANLMAGGEPNPFQWPIFMAGEMIGLIGFALSIRNR